MFFLILLLPLIYCTSGFCAFERLTVGAESMALSNSMMASPFSSSAVYHNPAALVYHQTHKITLNYRTFYGIPGLIQGDISGIHRIFGIPAGWGINYFGNGRYQESRVLFAGSMTVGKMLSLGFGVTCYNLSVAGYGNAAALGINLSFSARVSDDFFYGAMVVNCNRPGIGKTGEPLPQSFDIGICYLPANDLFFTLDFYKESRFKPEVRAGMGYRLLHVIILRAGVEDRIESFSMGFGLKFTKFRFDYAVAIHPVLNISQAISFLVEL